MKVGLNAGFRGDLVGVLPCSVEKQGSWWGSGGTGVTMVSAPWFPPLVHRMEGRRVETLQNIQRGQEKVGGGNNNKSSPARHRCED